jgi:hypothetical protein
MSNAASQPGRWGVLCLFAALALGGRAQASSAGDVTTYHMDNNRTGWNPAETVLTPLNVASPNFGLQSQVPVDEQVDAQPLFVAGETISGHGKHDVVYVATENDTVYAIDANSGAVLLSRTLGTAVPDNELAIHGCSNNSDVVGINSTPVIDLAAGTMYVMVYTYENKKNIYRLHALNLSDLTDKVAPVVVTGAGTLSDGTTYTFQARYQRQRPALLETSGNIYAGFGSFCDLGTKISRGWLLGWQAGTLAPLPTNDLINRQATTKHNFFLSSIWMSGYGIASDDKGSLFFATGNSDPGGKAYSPTENIEESVVRMSSDLTTLQDYFTPKDHAQLDKYDNEIGGAGVLLLPKQGGKAPPMAVIAGKTDYMYLLDRDHLGHVSGTDKVLGDYTDNGCWCGQSYFVGYDGIGRVVSSTGNYISVWGVQTSPAPALVLLGSGDATPSGQDPGFFTSISSNGTLDSTAIIWALPHPADNDPTNTIYLYAYDPEDGTAPIWTGAAGTWPFVQSANANLVPVAAGGHVFVASYKSLSIFGLSSDPKFAHFVPAPQPPLHPYGVPAHQIYGTVVGLEGDVLSLRKRDGSVVSVDVAPARRDGAMAQPAPGHATLVRGDSYDTTGRLVATTVIHAKDSVLRWGPDR